MWFFIACALLEPAACREARDAAVAAWSAAAGALEAEATRLQVEAKAAEARAGVADAEAADLEGLPVPKTGAPRASHDAFTRALATGADLGEAATAADEAAFALQLRKASLALERQVQRAEAMGGRMRAWTEAEARWRDAGGVSAAATWARQTTDGADLVLAPLAPQVGNRRVAPALPLGAAAPEEAMTGAARAHAGRLVAAAELADRARALYDARQVAERLVERASGDAAFQANADILSAANEARLVVRRGGEAQAALEAAEAEAEALDAGAELRLATTPAGAIDAARAAGAARETACR